MGGPLRTGVCVAIWVMVVARAEAQGDIQQGPETTAGPFPTLEGPRRFFINGPTNPGPTFEGLKSIGGRVEKRPSGATWLFGGHKYDIDDDTGTRRATQGFNGHTGGVMMTHAGEATQEVLHPPIRNIGKAMDGQVSAVSSGQAEDKDPDSPFSGPGENKNPPAPGTESADWSRDSKQWAYLDGEWMVVDLPDPHYPSLPTPSPPAAVLVAATNEKVEVERNVSGVANVTLHYRFYLSDNQAPDTPPELKVYQVVNGSFNLLQEDRQQGAWQERTVIVPPADNSSILFEGWRKGDGNVVALSDVDVTGDTLSTDEALDAGDEMTLTPGQPNATVSLTPTPAAEGNQTQDFPAPVEGSVATDTKDQDGNTTSVSPDGTQSDPSLDGTAGISQNPAEVEGGNVTEAPVDPSELEVSTDEPQNETRTSEQISGRTDVVALNSSTSGGDNATAGDESGYFSSTTPTDGEESDTDEGMPITTAVPDEETATENVLELDTDQNTNDTSKLPASDLPTNPLPTNASVTLPDGNTTVASGNTSRQVPTKPQVTDEGQDVSGGSELTPGTTVVAPQSAETPGNVTPPSDVTNSVEENVPESTTSPLPAGNSTEAVMAVPVSSTSWQVFQVFLVLCVLGLIALGFLYWKKKRRQDDEIPVFTRHTDYHNPTFSMEDAANFMSRSGRNTYKTIE